MYDYKSTMKYLIKQSKDIGAVVIFGAFANGRRLSKWLRQEKIKIECFCDNNNSLWDEVIEGIKVITPKRAVELYPKALYIVASAHFAEEMKSQLLDLGISEQAIICYGQHKGEEYYKNLELEYYEEEIQDMYWRHFGKYLNLENPQTYNEKINWEKLHDKDERKTILTDKYLVRNWVKEQIGSKYLNELYGVWDDAEDIDFSKLPERYVLKLTHGCGWNIIVKDQRDVKDEAAIRKQLNEWKQKNLAYYYLEMHYKNIQPRIIAEEYLENEEGDLYDYKVFCFHGEPKYIMFLAERKSGELKMAFYDTEWKKQPFVYSHPMYEKEVPKPANLNEILELSRILSSGFSHVRVDWYNLNENRIIFGEMTFSSCAGIARWDPECYDRIFGDMI